ncbi:MAG: YceI family protein [Lapillicoccus sp.]
MTTTIQLRTASGRWSADATRTDVSFDARGLFGQMAHGIFPLVAARVDVHEGRLEVTATLDAAGLDTSNARRDKDLRGKRFFAVAEHPTLTFRSTDSQVTAEGWVVDGPLMLRGQSCPLRLTVAVEDLTDDIARVRAEGEVDLRETPIRVPGLMIGRRVPFRVTSVLHRLAS